MKALYLTKMSLKGRLGITLRSQIDTMKFIALILKWVGSGLLSGNQGIVSIIDLKRVALNVRGCDRMTSEPDISYLGFEDTTNAIMCFDYVTKKIEICTMKVYGKKLKRLIEKEIEAIISHETMHAIIDYRESTRIARAYDYLGEYVGYTPYSYPRGL